MNYRTIVHPEWLQIRTETGVSYGFDQEWFTDAWQRRAGCGPTTATQVVMYRAYKDGLLNPGEHKTIDSVLPWMEKLWTYVTPGHGGLYKTRWFVEGVQSYLHDNQLGYSVKSLSIYPFNINRPTSESVAEFIDAALSEDCPVGFLNRHRGKEEGLSTWHWVPLIGMRRDGKEYRCFVYDEGMERYFSLNQWLKDSTLGGGFVFISKK